MHDIIVGIIWILGVYMSMAVCYFAYEKKWPILYRYAPPIYCFFMGIILEKFAKITNSPPQYIKVAISMMLVGWGFWFLAWVTYWHENRKKKHNKTD